MQSPQVAAPIERPENPGTQRGKNGLPDPWGIHAVRAVLPYLIKKRGCGTGELSLACHPIFWASFA
jgi:hypothetical protein